MRPGDTLSFYELNTLRPLAMRVPVLSTARLKNATAALAMAARMNAELWVQQRSTTTLSRLTQTVAADRPRPPFSAKPPILPIDVCGLEGEPACALRAWDVHLGGAALPAAVGKYTLVHIDGRDAHGAVLESNYCKLRQTQLYTRGTRV